MNTLTDRVNACMSVNSVTVAVSADALTNDLLIDIESGCLWMYSLKVTVCVGETLIDSGDRIHVGLCE